MKIVNALIVIIQTKKVMIVPLEKYNLAHKEILCFKIIILDKSWIFKINQSLRIDFYLKLIKK